MNESLDKNRTLSENGERFSLVQTIKHNMLSVLSLVKPKTKFEVDDVDGDIKRFGLFNKKWNQISWIAYSKYKKSKWKFQTVWTGDIHITTLKKWKETIKYYDIDSRKVKLSYYSKWTYDKYWRLDWSGERFQDWKYESWRFKWWICVNDKKDK